MRPRLNLRSAKILMRTESAAGYRGAISRAYYAASATPISMAGVQRSVWWMRAKL